MYFEGWDPCVLVVARERACVRTQTPIRIVTVEKLAARPALVLMLQIPTCQSIMHCLVQISDLYFFIHPAWRSKEGGGIFLGGGGDWRWIFDSVHARISSCSCAHHATDLLNHAPQSNYHHSPIMSTTTTPTTANVFVLQVGERRSSIPLLDRANVPSFVKTVLSTKRN